MLKLTYIWYTESLTTKYCSKNNLCFWVDVASINPVGEKTIFFFDCTLYKYSRSEYADKPDLRILLSFKSPFTIDELKYTNRGEYRKLDSTTPCDKGDVEKCITTAINEMSREVERAWEVVQKTPKTPSWLRFIFPARDQRIEAKGAYYGVLTKRDLVVEIVKLMGYRENYLEAIVKQTSVLMSLNLDRNELYALIGNKPVKLEAHRKIINFETLVPAVYQSK